MTGARAPGKRQTVPTKGLTYTCHQCGLVSAWTAAERHADETHHARIRLNVGPVG